MNKRDNKIDYIRALCTLLVILAHMEIPGVLNEIRTFDVVALVLVSGLSVNYAEKKGYINYIKKRIKKLVIPTYTTITFIFLLSFVFCYLFRNNNQLFDANTMLKSYFFAGGIGYIWIVKVYLAIALTLPIIKKIVVESKKWFWVELVLFWGIYLVLEMRFGNNKIMYEYFFQIFPYILVASIGVFLFYKPYCFSYIFTISSFITIIYAIGYQGFTPSLYKFPPKGFYMAYGLAAACGLYLLMPQKPNTLVNWISRNSFNIYLWHIVLLFITNALGEVALFAWICKWFFQFPIIVIASILLTYLQVWAKVKVSRIGRELD